MILLSYLAAFPQLNILLVEEDFMVQQSVDLSLFSCCYIISGIVPSNFEYATLCL